MLIDHPEKQSYFIEVLDAAMMENPKYFKKYYYGTEKEIAYKRKYSFSDRCRYYYADPEVQAAIEKLRSGELSEDNLEDVAGGSLLITPLMPIPMLLAICPRCHKIYIRSKGHRCSRGHTSSGGRHG